MAKQTKKQPEKPLNKLEMKGISSIWQYAIKNPKANLLFNDEDDVFSQDHNIKG